MEEDDQKEEEISALDWCGGTRSPVRATLYL
jgi:hypothetical protein